MWISRKKYDEMQALIKSQLVLLEKAADAATLIQIERSGKLNKFVFARRNEVYQIEVISMLSDNMPEWKEKLLR